MISRLEYHIHNTSSSELLAAAACSPEAFPYIFSNPSTLPEHVDMVFNQFPIKTIREKLPHITSGDFRSSLSVAALEALVINDARIDYTVMPYLTKFGLTENLAETIFSTPRLLKSAKISAFLKNRLAILPANLQEHFLKRNNEDLEALPHLMFLPGSSKYITDPLDKDISATVTELYSRTTSTYGPTISSFIAASWKDRRFVSEAVNQLDVIPDPSAQWVKKFVSVLAEHPFLSADDAAVLIEFILKPAYSEKFNVNDVFSSLLESPHFNVSEREGFLLECRKYSAHVMRRLRPDFDREQKLYDISQQFPDDHLRKLFSTVYYQDAALNRCQRMAFWNKANPDETRKRLAGYDFQSLSTHNLPANDFLNIYYSFAAENFLHPSSHIKKILDMLNPGDVDTVSFIESHVAAQEHNESRQHVDITHLSKKEKEVLVNKLVDETWPGSTKVHPDNSIFSTPAIERKVLTRVLVDHVDSKVPVKAKQRFLELLAAAPDMVSYSQILDTLTLTTTPSPRKLQLSSVNQKNSTASSSRCKHF